MRIPDKLYDYGSGFDFRIGATGLVVEHMRFMKGSNGNTNTRESALLYPFSADSSVSWLENTTIQFPYSAILI